MRDAKGSEVHRDGAWFERLYAAYRSRVYGFLFRMAGTRDQADDLFQETWLRVTRSWAIRGAADIADETAWLFTIARNVFLSDRRASVTKARGVEQLQLVAESVCHSPERIAAAQQETAALERALAEMTEDDRAILWLVAAEGLQQQQVARVLGIGYAAARQRLARARDRLADRLAAAETGYRTAEARKERQR